MSRYSTNPTTRLNLVRRKIIAEKGCQCCTGVPESALHAIWECVVAQDVWSGCAIRLQKCTTVFHDILAFFEYLLDRLSVAEFDIFLVQVWFIWHQRNAIIYGGQIRDPKWLNQRAVEYLDVYRNVQNQMSLPNTATLSRQS